MQNDHFIVGILVHDRFKQAPKLQELFTQYGCNIKTRLGLHEVKDSFCAISGLVILELIGEKTKIEAFLTTLKEFKNLEVQSMFFEHTV